MEYTRDQIIDGLRKLAEMLESNPLMDTPWQGSTGTMLIMSLSRESFIATVKAFGSGRKEDGGDTLNFTPENFPLNVKVLGFKSSICEQRMVTRTFEAQPAMEIPAHVIPARAAHEETVIQYVCTPFLAPEVKA